MRTNVAETLGLPLEAVSVKATTNEGLGSIGRGEGLAALALVQIELISD
jgi:2-C-methyl-D-erythritol 4-phosphate cytidylyltransferase/2-C-methyl-D-erythritol 2,4-cyclodiphosphate synthase